MPVAKQKAASANAVMKPAETNDSLDTFIRQAIGKEPSLSFSKTGDSPIQWIQLLHALDQQGTDLPGWPLLSPVKIQLQKCEKCSREFCSTINYRRHIRLHRRSLNLDRDSNINTREALGTFWDKLSSEEAMEIVSFKDVTLEELAGSSIIKALTSFIRKPGFSSLPPAYMKAGAALLDIVQARPSRFPMMARELFNILDDASEKTFLCAGKAESLQKYVFDGEAGKIGLEIRNLVACTSFLIEQRLVKAWLADKDAESLRCQKLLVEEEEAAQKRQAELLERKRLKKLRQKAKAQPTEAVADSQADSPDTSDGGILSPSASGPLDPLSTPSEIPDFLQDSIQSSHEPTQRLIGDGCETNELLPGPDIGCSGSNAQVEHKTYRRNGPTHPSNSRWHAQKVQRGSSGFHTKLGSTQKHTFYRDSRTTSFNNVNKVWTPKPKSENDEESCRTRLNTEETRASDQQKTLEVLIGSISVAIGNCNNQTHEEQPGNLNASDTEPPAPKCCVQDKPSKADNRPVIKHWRPVNRLDSGGRDLVKNASDGSEVDALGCKGSDESLRASPDGSDHESNPISAGKVADHLVAMKFSSSAAEAFLAQRWKEAVAADHLEPVVPESEPPGCTEVGDEGALACNGENQVGSGGAVETKSKYRLQVKYIPKQRSS